MNNIVKEVRIEIMEFVKLSTRFSEAKCSLDQVPSFKILDLVLLLSKKKKKIKREKERRFPWLKDGSHAMSLFSQPCSPLQTLKTHSVPCHPSWERTQQLWGCDVQGTAQQANAVCP